MDQLKEAQKSAAKGVLDTQIGILNGTAVTAAGSSFKPDGTCMSINQIAEGPATTLRTAINLVGAMWKDLDEEIRLALNGDYSTFLVEKQAANLALNTAIKAAIEKYCTDFQTNFQPSFPLAADTKIVPDEQVAVWNAALDGLKAWVKRLLAFPDSFIFTQANQIEMKAFLEGFVSQMEARLQGAKSQMAKVLEGLTRLPGIEADLQTKTGQLEQANQTIQNQTTDLGQLREQVNSLTDERNQLRTRAETAESALSDAQTQLGEFRSQIAQLQEESSTTSNALGTLQAQLSEVLATAQLLEKMNTRLAANAPLDSMNGTLSLGAVTDPQASDVIAENLPPPPNRDTSSEPGDPPSEAPVKAITEVTETDGQRTGEKVS